MSQFSVLGKHCVLVAVAVSLLVPVFGGGVAAHHADSIAIDVPAEPTAEESVTLSATIHTKDRYGDHETDGTVRLFIDSEQVQSKTVTIADGETKTVSFTVTFESAGSHDLTIEAEGSFGTYTYSESRTTTIDVAAPSTWTATPSPPLDETTTVEGAAFPLPDSLQDDVDAYRSSVTADLAPSAFVLATRTDLYVVFARSPPQTGRATVRGYPVGNTMTTNNLTFGAMAASDVSVDTTGTEYPIQEIASNPDEHRLELVRVAGTYRRISSLTDPDTGANLTAPSTSGVVVSDARSGVELFQDLGTRARLLSQQPGHPSGGQVLSDPRQPHLHTFSFDQQFWVDAEATLDALVLAPGSAARRYVAEVGGATVAEAEEGTPLLYLVEDHYDTTSMSDVRRIKQQGATLDGEVVAFEARLYQERVSVQEVLEHNTGCGPTRLQLKEACVNVPQDVLLHGGVAWSSVPESREDGLLLLGASSSHQDAPSDFRQGRYRIVGEVVSTARINDSLPAGSVLLVYNLERIGSIAYHDVAAESRAIIENRTGTLVTRYRSQIGAESGRGQQTTVESIQPGQSTRVTFEPRQTGGVAAVGVRMTDSAADVRIRARAVPSLPSNVDAPPAGTVRTVHISVATESTAAIANATIRLRLDATVEPDQRVTVHRYHADTWHPLNTTIISRSGDGVVVRATTPGFSYFSASVTSRDAAPTPTSVAGEQSTPTTTSTAPGFEGASTLVAIIALVVIATRRSL